MNPKTHSFTHKLKEGQRHEAFLDRYFSADFAITPANPTEERSGIDRHFKRRRDGRCLTIQYKADSTAARTGNAFIETISVDRDNIPGWAYTCRADLLIYYIPPMGLAYVLEPAVIRDRVDAWQQTFKSKAIPNKGYNTIGVLVPLDEIERISKQVINL